MKIDVTQELKNLDGSTLVQARARCPECGRATETEAVTLRGVVTNALMVQDQSEAQVKGEEKARRYQLGLRIYGEESPDLSPEEIVLIRQRVAQMYQPLVVGQVWALLDPAEQD